MFAMAHHVLRSTMSISARLSNGTAGRSGEVSHPIILLGILRSVDTGDCHDTKTNLAAGESVHAAHERAAGVAHLVSFIKSLESVLAPHLRGGDLTGRIRPGSTGDS